MTAPTLTRTDDYDLTPYRCTELASYTAIDQDGDPATDIALVLEEAGPVKTVSVLINGAYLRPDAALRDALTAMFDLASQHHA